MLVDVKWSKIIFCCIFAGAVIDIFLLITLSDVYNQNIVLYIWSEEKWWKDKIAKWSPIQIN